MKNCFAPRLVPLWLLASMIPGVSHGGNPQFWNVDGSGGDGIWGTSPGAKNWNTSPGAPAGNTAWPDSIDDVAVFQDSTGGVVTVSDEPLQAAGIIQSGVDYIINAGVITLVPDSAAAKPFIDVQSGVLTIDSILDGTNGLIKSGGGTLTLSGSNTYSGTTSIMGGTLINIGVLGNAGSQIDIAAGATLDARGTQFFSQLTTSGAGRGTWLGDLNNPVTVAPGGVGATGILAVGGNFTQAPGGVLKMDVSASGNDILEITGSVGFDGTLDLNQAGAAIAPFVPVTLVSADAYNGNIASLVENLDGAVLFNPENGTVTRIAPLAGTGDPFAGATDNQTSTWISLYDDVIDPGITNITGGNSGYDISSGIADTGNPDLLWALSSSMTPGGLNAALLNRLSPEVYGSFSDYAMQATRAHQRTALSAPPLGPARKEDAKSSKSGLASDAKGGTKDALPAPPAALDWVFFAAADYFNAETDNSHNQADYELSGMGIMAGARTWLREQIQLGIYLAADSGSIDGTLIDADVTGWTFGLIGETLLDEKSRTRLTAGISYGSYAFDGSRGGASATATGWNHGNVDFRDADSDSFELSIGVESVAWQRDRFALIPSAGLRYAAAKMDSFKESTGGAPGAPIALEVDADHYNTLLFELGLLARAEVTRELSLWGELGVNVGVLDEGRSLSARFAKGGRTMRAEADGLDDDSVSLGFGAVYQITETINAGLGYRTDFRSGADNQHELRLSSSFRF